MAVKMSVNLPDETVNTLRDIAERNGVTLTAALRQAISNEQFIDDELKNGGKLLIEKDGEPLRQVVFKR